jgi:hypothetical protein
MEFNAECKVIIDSMNRDEASAFIKFLESEIARHKMDIDNAVELIFKVSNKFNLKIGED